GRAELGGDGDGLGLRTADHDDVLALRGQLPGGGCADAVAGAGDDDRLPTHAGPPARQRMRVPGSGLRPRPSEVLHLSRVGAKSGRGLSADGHLRSTPRGHAPPGSAGSAVSAAGPVLVDPERSPGELTHPIPCTRASSYPAWIRASMERREKSDALDSSPGRSAVTTLKWLIFR